MVRLPAALCAGVLLSTACARTVPPPDASAKPALARIQEWEDRRSLGDGELVRWATSAPDAAVRARALRALGRIQDAATLDAVVAGLTAPDAGVRDEAAFAAGQLALSWEPLPEAELGTLTRALVAAEAAEPEPRVHQTLLEALGKLATPGAVAALTPRLTPPDGLWVEAAARALGVTARKAGPAAVASVPLDAMVALTRAPTREGVGYAGAYLLATAKRPEAREALRACAADPSPDVAALCAKGLGDVGDPSDTPALVLNLLDPTPRRVAEAARALAKLAAKCPVSTVAPCEPLTALEVLGSRAKQVAAGQGAWGHPLLAVAQQGLPFRGRGVLANLRGALVEATALATSDEARADLAWLDCRFAGAMDRQKGVLEESLRCGQDQVPAERRLALGLHEVAQFKGIPSVLEAPPAPVPPAVFAVPYLTHASPLVRAGALDALTQRPVPGALAPIRALIAGDDAVVAGLAAATAGTLKDTGALSAVEALAARVPKEPDLAEAVAGALEALQGPAAEPRLREWLKHPHANVRRVAAEALTRITGAPVRSQRVELPADTYRPPAAAPGTSLLLRTRKGDITVRLDPEAPLTGGNLVALAKKGYFRAITFHRVVPDFVAQGGDPRGDGEGGPGYSLRCEVTRRPYTRGVVGMALSGKDTGGSQFFFTHSPQPHLDGRYTVFGEVVSGMDVVDALLEGTIIDDVRILYP